MVTTLITALAFAALAAWVIAVTAALSIIGLAPKGQKLKAYFALGWWRFARVEAIAGPAAAPYIARYRQAFLAFFACIFAAMAAAILLIFLQQN